MRAILISDHPKWCALEMNGKKNVEVRSGTALYKTTKKLIDEYGYAEFYVYNTRDERYRLDKELNGKYFVWDTKSKDYPFDKTRNRHYFFGKVVFKFRCYKVEEIKADFSITKSGYYGTHLLGEPVLEKTSCLTHRELNEYLKGDEKCNNIQTIGTAIHISDLEIFDKPKELSEFNKREKIIECYNAETNYHIVQYRNCKLTKAPQSWCYVESEK